MCFAVATLPSLAQITWTGATSSDWATATNWDLGRVPTADDDVVIPAVIDPEEAPYQPVIYSGTAALAHSVEVQGDFQPFTSLTIQNAGSLTINGSKSIDIGTVTPINIAFYSNATVDNSGKLVIGNTSSVGAYGLYHEGYLLGIFTNHLGGEISIDKSTFAGLYNTSGENEITFINEGKINIGANASVGSYGISNASGGFSNNSGGEIRIDRSREAALNNDRRAFINAGKIIIGANARVGMYGIQNQFSGYIENSPGGEISIDRSTVAGLYNESYALENIITNAGKITIGANAGVGLYGIQNEQIFTNNSTGEITIDRSTEAGLYNTSFTDVSFTNEGKIIIGARKSVGLYGIVNTVDMDNGDGEGFINFSCAILTIYAPLNNSGTFTNQGLFTSNTSQAHTNTSLTNDGVLVYPQGNPIPNVTNNALIVAPLNDCGPVYAPALQVGGSNTFTVGSTWYRDAAMTNPAGTYTYSDNTFTANRRLHVGTNRLYFTVTDPENGCTRTVSILITLEGSCNIVNSFTLVNASTDTDLRPLNDGDVIDLTTLPSKQLNIRAGTQPARVGSVVLELSGAQSYRRIENGPPYMLFGDLSGDIFGRSLPVGEYTLTATPYSRANGAGLAGQPLRISFTVERSEMLITSITAKEQSIAALGSEQNKDKWHLSAYPNPVVTNAYVEFRLPYSTQASITLVDISGRTYQQLYNGVAEGQVLYKKELNLQGLAPGIYFVRILTQEGKQITYQIVHQ